MIQQLSPEQVREITQTVLERREFQDDVAQVWLVEIAKRITEWFSRLSKWSAGNPDSARILIIVLGVVLLALLGHIGYTLVTEFLSLRKRSVEVDLRGQNLPALEGVAENWTEAFALARAALSSGDLYRAMWITHRILLSVLDIRKVVRFARWKTNSDYIRECISTDTAADTLREVTDAYEQVVYAHGNLDTDLANQLLARVEIFADKVNR